MPSSGNKTKQLRKIILQDVGEVTRPLPLLKETAYDRDTSVDLAVAFRMDEFPTMGMVAIHQFPEQEELRTIRRPAPWSSSLYNGIPIYDQPTWPLPAIRGSGTSGIQAPSAAVASSGRESYLRLIRNLIKNSGIYAIASLASPLITLLLAPFLTHTLSHRDYGALVLINVAAALVTGVAELGLGVAFVRVYSYECKARREQLDVLSTLVILLLLILIPITAVGLMTAPWLSSLLLGSASYSDAIRVGAVLVLTQNLTVPGLVWLRAESRAAFFAAISVANLLITAGTSIVMVGMLHMGIVGALMANGFGDAIIIICTLPVIFWRAGLHLRFALVGSMLAFGAPNVMNIISGWVLQLSDRYLLGHLVSLPLAAGYSVAYTLGGVLSTAIVAPFSLAWWVLMFAIAKREDARYVFKQIFRGFSFVLLFTTLGLSLFGSSVLALLFPAAYQAQSPIIPIIALSTMFNGIFIVVNLGPSLQRKTWLNSLYFIGSALINVGLNILLIPGKGTMGAALATLIAYIALALIAYLVNRRIYPVPFGMGLFLFALGSGIALYIIDQALVQRQSTLVAWCIHLGTLLVYGLWLLLLGWLLPSGKQTQSLKAKASN